MRGQVSCLSSPGPEEILGSPHTEPQWDEVRATDAEGNGGWFHAALWELVTVFSGLENLPPCEFIKSQPAVAVAAGASQFKLARGNYQRWSAALAEAATQMKWLVLASLAFLWVLYVWLTTCFIFLQKRLFSAAAAATFSFYRSSQHSTLLFFFFWLIEALFSQYEAGGAILRAVWGCFFRRVIVPGCARCSLSQKLWVYLQHSASSLSALWRQMQSSFVWAQPFVCLRSKRLLFCVFALISCCHFVYLFLSSLCSASSPDLCVAIAANVKLSASSTPRLVSTFLLLFSSPAADSDTSRDSTQPNSAGSRWPSQPSLFRLCREPGDHVGVRSPHRLQPDEPAASEPAAGTFVQPGQAAGTRSDIDTSAQSSISHIS